MKEKHQATDARSAIILKQNKYKENYIEMHGNNSAQYQGLRKKMLKEAGGKCYNTLQYLLSSNNKAVR